MTRLLGVIVLMTSLAALAGGKLDTSSWGGKKLALTERARSGLDVAKAGREILIGATGGAVSGNTSTGDAIMSENGIEDPAPRVAADLFKAAQDKYGVEPFARAPVARLANAKETARAAAGADLVLDVSSDSSIVQKPFQNNYSLTTQMYARLIDVHTEKAMRDVRCLQISDAHAKYAELLADHAARLKELLDAQRIACLGKFKAEVLDLSP
jgi:hypothetical protein